MAHEPSSPQVARSIVLPSGVSIGVPPGWHEETNAAATRLVSADGAFHAALVDVGPAADAADAARLAWRRYDTATPEHEPGSAAQETPRAGWSEWWTYRYDTKGEWRLVQANVVRHADRWFALLLNGAMDAYERNGGAILALAQTLLAPGHRREDLSGRPAQPLDAARIAMLRDFFEESRRALDIPGAALALVDRADIVLAEGFGVRVLGGAAVDADTRFLIASTTKPLTTLMLAKLVDEGRMAWDDPAHDLLPGLRTGDPALTRRLRVRDLLSASTGLPRKDFTSAFTFTAETPVERALDLLADVKPTTAFGTAFQYNNLIAAASGYLGGHVAFPDLPLGEAYDRAMATRVFAPLAMTRTTFDWRVAEDGTEARPHSANASGITVEVDMGLNHPIVATRPTGGAWSTARDLAAYVRNELLTGELPNGDRHLSAANLLFRRQPVVAIGADGAYGIGLFLDNAAGVPTLRHAGSLPGVASDFIAIPGAEVGAVILANAEAGAVLVSAFKRRLLEILFDAEPKAADEVAAAVARRASETDSLARSVQVPPPRAMGDALAPRYRSPDLGDLVVDRAGGELRLRFASGAARVGLRADGALFSVEPGLRGIVFELDHATAPPSIVIRDGQHEYRYAPVT